MSRNSNAWITAAALALTLTTLGLVTACGGADQEDGAPEPASEAAAAASEPAAAAEETATVDGATLAGTSWSLVQFQSMDDAIGTMTPEASQVYTMELNAEGRVAMQLNCNRATGTWSAEPSADGGSGSFEFGPLAMTRALCPPPSMDERIAKDAQYVRGYLLRDGQLHLSLMADGGIYSWEPIAADSASGGDVPFDKEPDAEIEAAIRQASPDYTKEMIDGGGGNPARYLHAAVDLDGDGRKEAFAYPLGSIFCGSGGCNLMLFTPADAGYRLVNSFSISRTPVIVSGQKTEGWSDLFKSESGGGAAASWVRYAFDGTKYVEKERLPGDPAPAGTKVLAGEFTFQDGIPLAPGE